ncbi:hypothetical protein Cgig2_015496 [Carnegiea gigantea]|uniref:Uncharacterized protein n=1 Tax=Carnegiea gigantea TaxID=171969 RepID=A0A9Q1QJ66_9CARY|nr:hypothetical protein Cgig2_015496 [Carnegiea gigantea]
MQKEKRGEDMPAELLMQQKEDDKALMDNESSAADFLSSPIPDEKHPTQVTKSERPCNEPISGLRSKGGKLEDSGYSTDPSVQGCPCLECKEFSRKQLVRVNHQLFAELERERITNEILLKKLHEQVKEKTMLMEMMLDTFKGDKSTRKWLKLQYETFVCLRDEILKERKTMHKAMAFIKKPMKQIINLNLAYPCRRLRLKVMLLIARLLATDFKMHAWEFDDMFPTALLCTFLEYLHVLLWCMNFKHVLWISSFICKLSSVVYDEDADGYLDQIQHM